MLHVLTDDQKVIRESLREFVEEEVRPYVPIMESTHRFPRELLRRCADLGLTGILFPEEYGGSDLGLETFCLALEEISRATQTLAIVLDANLTLCFLPILHAGTEEQKAHYLPRAIGGELIGAYAMSEPTGATNFAAHSTTAERDGDEWVLSGTKIFCTNSQEADVYLVLARVDDNPSPTCFIVESENPGLSFGEIEKKLGWHGSNTGTVILQNARVPANRMLGELHQGLAATLVPIFESCVGIGAMCVGAAEGAFSKTLEHVKTRNIQGADLITYQSVSDQMARMAMDIETSRALVYKTASMIDAGAVPVPGAPLTVLTSSCKVQPPEMAARVCDAAIQLHGGYGYIDDMDVHRYWRDVRACQIGEGPTSSHLAYIAAAITSQEVI